jgi:hypothetical protein
LNSGHATRRTKNQSRVVHLEWVILDPWLEVKGESACVLKPFHEMRVIRARLKG